MKRLSNSLRLVSVLLIVTLLAACAPGEQAPSAEEVEAAINTAVAQTMEAERQIAESVAMTVAAQEAEAAAAQPEPTATLPPPTETPELLPTLTPVLPTATSFATGSSSGGSGGSSGGSTATYKYSCDPDIRKRPFDNTEFKPGDHFDVKFTIKNTGTATWEAGKDLNLLGNPGNTLVAPPGTIELPEMKPGDLFSVGPFDAIAPSSSGHYVVDFMLEGGFCYPYVAFNVR